MDDPKSCPSCESYICGTKVFTFDGSIFQLTRAIENPHYSLEASPQMSYPYLDDESKKKYSCLSLAHGFGASSSEAGLSEVKP